MKTEIGNITIKTLNDEDFVLIATEESDYSQANMDVIAEEIERTTGKTLCRRPNTFTWHYNYENTDEVLQTVSVG